MSTEESSDSKKIFCCPLKEYYSKETNLTSTLVISPRVVLIKWPLKKDKSVCHRIQLTNKGIFPRSLQYREDSEDTEIRVCGITREQYVPANMTIQLEIIITPRKSKNNNFLRRIYIDADHPSITFEVPIIVLPKAEFPIYPEEVVFPRSITNSKTYYEFPFYNTGADEVNISIKSYSPSLTIDVACTKIKPKAFSLVLMRLKTKELSQQHGEFKLRIGPCVFGGTFRHAAKSLSLYVSTPLINFEETRFERTNVKTFTICNETKNLVPFAFSLEAGNRHLSILLPSNSDHEDSGVEDNGSGSSKSTDTDQSRELSPMEALIKTINRSNKRSSRANNDYKYFKIEPKQGDILANSFVQITVSFSPRIGVTDYGSDLSPPFHAGTDIKLIVPNNDDYSDLVHASGLIDGPEVYISPKTVDFRQVFLGEEHCEQIHVTNTDGVVDTEINYYDYSGEDMAKVFIRPKEGLLLRPCEQDIFQFTFYTTIVGKICFKVRFKIKNGRFLTVVVKADSQPVRVKSFPELIEFGSVPIGVPQKRQVLLMNPLSVPISLQCFLVDGGTERPLVLNVDNIDELPPIDIKNPLENVTQMLAEDRISAYSESDIIDETPSESVSYNSFLMDNDELSVCSSAFQREVINPIKDIANRVVNAIKAKRLPEKNEPETKVIAEATHELLALPYFADLTRYNNYACMDWDAIPSDPCEVHFDGEIIHLKPNAGRSLTVLIVPNTPGYFNRAIHVRCCPHRSHCEDEADESYRDKEGEILCESSMMTTKLYVEYNCRVPLIKWESNVKFTDRVIYANQVYEFEMSFENQSNIGGFLHYVLVPCGKDGVMKFTQNCWKYFIPAEESVTAYCSVEFKRIGDIILSGMIKVVGYNYGMPFHITAHVLPPRIKVHPKSIYKRQQVLEATYVKIFITNLTPTITGFTLKLLDDSHQSLDTYGAQLGPDGQGTYVIVRSFFRDPYIYKNAIYIDMLHGEKLKIPMTYEVTGYPVRFEPDVKNVFDAGTIILSCEKDFKLRTTNYSRYMRIWNEGERPYAVTFQKIKGNSESTQDCSCCLSEEVAKAQFFIYPKEVFLPPGGVAFVTVNAIGCKEVTLYNEFLIKIQDQLDSQRFTNRRFVLKGRFASAELIWQPREAQMVYNKTHKFLDHPQIEIVKLINNSDAEVRDVCLEVCGPFKIKPCYEQPFKKKFKVDFTSYEQKEITILLNKAKLERENLRRYPIIKGRILIYMNCMPLKSLGIVLKVNCPDVIVVESEIVLFTACKEDFTEILIENVGLLDAYYKWKKLDEKEEYVSETENVWKFALDLLNDLMRMIDMHESIDYENDAICQQNMTWCYQKYRCLLNEISFNDPIGVVDIIDEIIANLDLTQKRYKTKICESDEDDADMEDAQLSASPSSHKNVKKTLDKIVSNLKIEESYQVSEASVEECDKKQHIYFCRKEGIVQPQRGAKCLLHMPPVREGYAMKSEFELDVIGGKPQKFAVTLVNLANIIELAPESYYLGVKPWYEMCTSTLAVKNITAFRINIEVLNPKETKRDHFHLVHGYADVLKPSTFYLNGHCTNCICTEGIMGFSAEFIRNIKLRICDRQIKMFRLRGQGIMPIFLTTSSKLYPRIQQHPNEIIEEYQILQKLYYFEMFKDITFMDDDLEGPCMGEEGEDGGDTRQTFATDLNFIFETDSEEYDDEDEDDEDENEAKKARNSILLRNERLWQILLSTYIFAYNDQSLPNAIILEQLMNIVKFKNRLKVSTKAREILNSVYRQHLKMLCTYDEKMPINVKYFTVQPLPFQQLGYIIEMSDLKLNQFRRYEIELQFLGPGKLIASARTAIKIPGIYVHFEIYENSGCDKFEVYRAEGKMPDFYVKKYRNMWERQIDAEADPKLHHAHSYDCEGRCKFHKRELAPATAKTRRDIHNYYNSLNKSVYLENKHHYTNCTIFSKCKHNFSGSLMRVHILLKPDKKYFTEGQLFEDFLFIDLHMGPTLPVLMRGLIN